MLLIINKFENNNEKINIFTKKMKASGGRNWICVYGRTLYCRLYNNSYYFHSTFGRGFMKIFKTIIKNCEWV